MPKMIENIPERAIAEARTVLLEDGYEALTIRRIAGKLGIGLGTIYNYFPSKDYLAAGVMLEDWQAMTRDFEKMLPGRDIPAVLRAMFDMVHDFSQRYIPAWKEYEHHSSSRAMISRYHTKLVSGLSAYIKQVLPPEQIEREPFLADFLAEILLRFGSEPDYSYERIEPALNKLLRP